MKTRKEYYEGGQIPWLLSGEVAQGEVWTASNFITAAGLKYSSAKVFPPDTVLVAMYGATAGQVGILKIEAATNQAICGILPSDQFVPEYIYYFLLSKKDELVGKAAGNAQPNISQAKIRETIVPIVDKTEQLRTVAILDEVLRGFATAKANAEKNLHNARIMFDSHLARVFATAFKEWPVSSVGKVADCCLGKMLDKVKNKGDPKPYLRNLNVRWFHFDLTDVQEMRFTSDEHERYSVRKGDVVICEGGYPGRAAIWEQDEPIYIQKALHRVRFPAAIFGRWFLYFLYSQEASGALRQYFTGTGIQHFTGAALSRLKLPLPSHTVTTELVGRLDALAKNVAHLEDIYRSKIAAFDNLKKAILQQAFSGKL